jgi:hypothetical protein
MQTVPFSCLPGKLNETNSYCQPYDKLFFPTPTTIAAVGSRGSGKTYSLMRYNRYMFDRGYFTRMYVINPTIESNQVILENAPVRRGDIYQDRNAGPDAIEDIQNKVVQDVNWYKDITEMYAPMYQRVVANGFLSLNKAEREYMMTMQEKIETFYLDFTESLQDIRYEAPAVQQILDGMTPLPKARGVYQTIAGETEETLQDKDITPYLFRPPNLPRPAPVLFIDDMSHTSLYSPSPTNPLVNLTLRHRHLGGKGYGITLEYAVQTLKSGMQRAMRANTMQFMLYKTHALDILDSIYEELGAFTTKEAFQEMYHMAVKEKHSFLLVDVNATHPDRVFRKGFEEFILAPPANEPGLDSHTSSGKSSKKRKKPSSEEPSPSSSDMMNPPTPQRTNKGVTDKPPKPLRKVVAASKALEARLGNPSASAALHMNP